MSVRKSTAIACPSQPCSKEKCNSMLPWSYLFFNCKEVNFQVNRFSWCFVRCCVGRAVFQARWKPGEGAAGKEALEQGNAVK